MAENVIITIGRQFGSGGHEVGRELAAELGLKLYDKELLKVVAEESGICEKVLENYDEKPTNSLLYSLVMDVYPSMNYVGTTLNQQIYQAQFDSIRKLGQTGNCVIVGRAADYILRDNKNVTSVFIHASLDFRAGRVAEFEKISEAKAKDMVLKADKKRASFYNFQTEKKWGAASGYHLSIDTSSIGIDGAVQLIKTYIELKNRH
jgi:cytidylate kinase